MNLLRYKNQAGFTLYESLVSLLLTMLVLATFSAFSRFQLFAMLDQTSQLEMQTAARSMADLFASEIRRTCALVTAKTDEVRIMADLDASGAIDGVDEDVTYRYDRHNHAIKRIAGGVTEVLTDKAVSCNLRYFDINQELQPQNGGSLSIDDRKTVRRIRMEVLIRGNSADPAKDELLSAPMATDVSLRNRYFVNNIQNTTCDAGWNLQG